jgi:hypothetical protein
MPKSINTSHTTDTIGLPFLARSVDWLQEKTDEQDIGIIQSLNQNTNPSEVWQFFYKNIRTTGGGVWLWDEGGVLYNNKIYLSPSGTATLGGGESLVYYFITTAQVGEPTQYTDASSFQTNEEIRIGICKNTENVSQQIQAVNLLRYINLEKTYTFNSGSTIIKLMCRGNLWTLSMTGAGVVGDNYLIIDNYKGNTFSFLVPTKSNNDVPDFITITSTAGVLRVVLPAVWNGSGSDSKSGPNFGMSYSWIQL